jgi:hypothetical protein
MRIVIYRSAGRAGSVIGVEQVAELYEDELPDNINEIVEEYEGDYYEVQNS